MENTTPKHSENVIKVLNTLALLGTDGGTTPELATLLDLRTAHVSDVLHRYWGMGKLARLQIGRRTGKHTKEVYRYWTLDYFKVRNAEAKAKLEAKQQRAANARAAKAAKAAKRASNATPVDRPVTAIPVKAEGKPVTYVPMPEGTKVAPKAKSWTITIPEANISITVQENL